MNKSTEDVMVDQLLSAAYQAEQEKTGKDKK